MRAAARRLRPRAWTAALLVAGGTAVGAPESSGLRHDPFVLPPVLRLPAPAAAGAALAGAPAAAPLPPAWQPRLAAVLVAGGRSMVLVDGSVVEVGQEISGHKLVRVGERSAVFVGKGGATVELTMDSAGRAAASP